MQTYYRYWGKIQELNSDDFECHLLPYHSLDVASVAMKWWDSSPAIRNSFRCGLGESVPVDMLRAWVLYFIALHDIGKFDLRFQMKSMCGLRAVRKDWVADDCGERSFSVHSYAHGIMGYLSAYRDNRGSRFLFAGSPWLDWLAAVTGHHGEIPGWDGKGFFPADAEGYLTEMDNRARSTWYREAADLFLRPAGLAPDDIPPPLSNEAQRLLAGFCSVCDWIGSNKTYFPYESERLLLGDYLSTNSRRLAETAILIECGLEAAIGRYRAITELLPVGAKPRNVQSLADKLPLESGLSIVEAQTGTGKTELGLAYAWRLIDAGMADSIIFALPTQATANAMFSRVCNAAEAMFPQGGVNAVLAHGTSRFNPAFRTMMEVGRTITPQGGNEAAVQCAAWLSSSRKRVFLGQIGISTVDQVLLSALPVRHGFVRTFGLGKSVLLIDEVHAYDAYMYGLLEEVLRRQSALGGSAILLSATLPSRMKSMLIRAWEGKVPELKTDGYPLITHVAKSGRNHLSCEATTERHVEVEVLESEQLYPDVGMLKRMVEAANNGALVSAICNTVDDAQRIATDLRAIANVPVDLFHARFRFSDRQIREQEVISVYGKDGLRQSGLILVATQVVEQSLDLDFDWVITFICPVDLLFQRIGRLHRHERTRPLGFQSPCVTVIAPPQVSYGVHEIIYGDRRLLWRTQQLLKRCGGTISFPSAYRDWIELVYQEAHWGDEPCSVQQESEKFAQQESARRLNAIALCHQSITLFGDTDDKIAALTRDSEARLSLVLLANLGGEACFIDGTPCCAVPEIEKDERLLMEAIPVPAGWAKYLPATDRDTSVIMLSGTLFADGSWRGLYGNTTYQYSSREGLRKEIP